VVGVEMAVFMADQTREEVLICCWVNVSECRVWKWSESDGEWRMNMPVYISDVREVRRG
jgi:hypothetical protein